MGQSRFVFRSTRAMPFRCLALLCLLPLATSCAVVTVAGAAAGAAISVTGAVVSTTVSVTGKAISAAIPDGDDDDKDD
jgi:hypothetical protein